MANSQTKVCFLLILYITCTFATQVSYDGRAIKIDGVRKILLSGSIHYPRSTPEMWSDLINKAKEGGLDAIDTYVFWNAHERVQRHYNFTGNLDLIGFIKTIQAAELYVVLRIGPYVCAEWNFGGLPVWLLNQPDYCEFRTNNTIFMNEMATFTNLIVNMLSKERLFASQGGPIILAQIENEYGNVMSEFGDAGKQYLNYVANLANSINIGIPWFMCQQSDAPQPIINTCNGFYCDQFTPNNPNSPKMWTENWTGWFKTWGSKDPHRPAEDLAFAVARFFQTGGTYQNYYMYHGGTNFGRAAGGPYITTSYDYDAPLNEYGGYNQPKYSHLKEFHDVLHSIERILTDGNVTTDDLGNSVQRTIYTLNGTSSCFFSNGNETSEATVTNNGVNYIVPAWSVSILPDCKSVVYNTAKVNTQTTVMEKILPQPQENLSWSWRPEYTPPSLYFGNETVGDQKSYNDTTDYFWYTLRMPDIDQNNSLRQSDRIALSVPGNGQIMHVFINGEYVDSKWGSIDVDRYVFEMDIDLRLAYPDTTVSVVNEIKIASTTVGLPNYGAFYERKDTGLGRPIQLIGKRSDGTTTSTVNIGTLDRWYVQYGQINHPNTWFTDNYPTNRRMTWYKTTFKTPVGKDPVVVDLQGMGKGDIWVNNFHLGRFWASYIAENNCSSDPCDYRGPYTSSKCANNCGQPTQRWFVSSNWKSQSWGKTH